MYLSPSIDVHAEINITTVIINSNFAFEKVWFKCIFIYVYFVVYSELWVGTGIDVVKL